MPQSSVGDQSLAQHDSMADILRVVWFCDDTPLQDKRRLFNTIQNQVKDKRFSLVALFLAHALTAVKQEVFNLDREGQRECVGSLVTFLDVLDVAETTSNGLGGAFHSFLQIVLDIALFIGSYESQRLPYNKSTRPSLLAALSVGMLPAAAVAMASSLPDLIIIGAEVARVAFRIGIHVHRTSRLLDARPDGTNCVSWVYAVTSLSLDEVEKEISMFNRTALNDGITRLYISAVDQSSVTVTGPPSRLKQAFYTSPKLRYAKWTALPVYDGLAHAPHLYSEDDVQQIVRPLLESVALPDVVVTPILSSHTGQPFPARNGYQLLTQVTSTLLTKRIHLDDLVEGILDHVSRSARCIWELATFERCRGSRLLLEALETKTITQAGYSLTQKDMAGWTQQSLNNHIPRSRKCSKLAIVGMACRMPGGADSPKLFWDLLMEGRDTCSTVPSDRFDLGSHFDPTGRVANTTKAQYGNFIRDPGKFDAAFFNMSPREADNTDPAARLALVTAYEALEMAGYTPDRRRAVVPERVGTYMGQASDDWRELNASQNINAFIVPGGVRAFVNGRINYVFKFGGPSVNIDTACSSGLAAVHAACSALWADDVDMAIAGGVNIITDPDNYSGLDQAGFLSRTGQCKVWDETADGYCRADGIGTVVIKRLEDAEADHDNIIAVILSGSTNHSANALSITHPEPVAQSQNYTNVIRQAGINAFDVTYAELHGTGTQAGDAVEAQSIEAVFAPAWPRRKADQKLFLGAVKSNIGHGEAAAGIASMIKVLLCLQHQTIPAHIGIRTRLNPNIPEELLGSQGAVLARENTFWPQPASGIRRAVVNSFGAHGGNTTLLLEEAPKSAREGTDPRTVHPIVVSAKSRQSLARNLRRLHDFLEENPGTAVGDLSYTLSARRMHHNLRVGLLGTNVTDIKSWLVSTSSNLACLRSTTLHGPKVVFVFSGQGSYYHGIATQLIQESRIFREEIDLLNRIVVSLGLPSVCLLADPHGKSIEDASIVSPQLTITVIQLALVSFLAKLNITPNVVVGHSLGEYAALVACGILSAADAIMLVGRRAVMMQERCTIDTHGLLAVRSPDASAITPLEHILDTFHDLEVACINDSQSFTVAGPQSSLAKARDDLERTGFSCTSLQLPFAFHSSQMDSILHDFERLGAKVAFQPPQVPYLSPLLKRTIYDACTIDANYLRRSCRESVDFRGAMASALKEDVFDAGSLFLEIGPHPVLLRSIRNASPQSRTLAILNKTEPDWTSVGTTLVSLHCAGVPVDWNEYFSEYEKSHRLCHLPAYAWNENLHWIPYAGRWTLDKANAKTAATLDLPSLASSSLGRISVAKQALHTSSVHEVLKEAISAEKVHFVTISDTAHPELRSSLNGHRMNGHGVASSSLWCDMAFTVAQYVYDRLSPGKSHHTLTILGLECSKAQVIGNQIAGSQKIRLEVSLQPETTDLCLRWQSLLDQPIASRTLEYLIKGRIAALDALVLEGSASRLSKAMAYKIFGSVVVYSPEYQGMERVVMTGYEAYADIRLNTPSTGSWRNPPCWIDSISHIAGLVMNGCEETNTTDYFWVTPGFKAFRLAEALEIEAVYRSYVRMMPTDDPKVFTGDVFIMREGQMIGLLEQIKFRQIPRLLMDQFFSPSAQDGCLPQPPSRLGVSQYPKPQLSPSSRASAAQTPSPSIPSSSLDTMRSSWNIDAVHEDTRTSATSTDEDTLSQPSSLVNSFIQVLASETGLCEADLGDDRTFMELGVDSLMSLVLTTRLREKLGIEIKHSIFLEHERIGKMKQWLVQNL
ncbi:hypothetical protein BST61_g5332 [Cercospora zeina]